MEKADFVNGVLNKGNRITEEEFDDLYYGWAMKQISKKHFEEVVGLTNPTLNDLIRRKYGKDAV